MDNTKLNIPSASEIVPATQTDLVKVDNEQSSIIEKAFANRAPDADKVTVELDKPLTNKLWKEITQRGYNVSQKMTYDSRDTETHNGKYKVTIYKPTDGIMMDMDENFSEINAHITEMKKMFSYNPFRFYPFRHYSSMWL